MDKKRELARFCGWTGNRRESVPPRPEAPASTQIFVSDIHSTDECQLAIDDYDFSMIPEVDLKPKTEPTAGFERLSGASTPPQLANVPSWQRTASNLMLKEADRHALPPLSDQPRS